MASPVHVLLSMGFPRDRVVNALLQTKNDLDSALDILSQIDEPRRVDSAMLGNSFLEDDAAIARALQLQMRDEEAAWRAQREADDEALAIEMQRRMAVAEERAAAAPARLAVHAATAQPVGHPPPPPGENLTKKQRQNRRKREIERTRRENVREVSRMQEARRPEL